MTMRTVQRICWWAAFSVIVLGLTATPVVDRHYTADDLVIIPLVGYALVGMLVSHKRPGNPVGWIFLLVGVLTSLAGLSGAGVTLALGGGAPYSWWVVLSVWYNDWFWYPLFMLATTFTFLLFPSGLASSRWRPVLWLSVVATVTATVLGALAPTLEIGVPPGSDQPLTMANPVSPELVSGLDASDSSWWILAPLTVGLFCGLAAIVSVVLRTWRSRGVERLQMRLFAFAIILVPLQILVSELVPSFGTSLLGGVTFAAALTFIAVACGLAILRYHLYDIDRVIGRTTAYVLVTGVLLAVYATVVTSVSWLLQGPQTPTLAVAVATLAAAAVVRPVLRWAQHVVNRRFNREQYDAVVSVEEFAGRLRDAVDSDEIERDLLALLDRTVQPSRAGLWLRGASS